MKNITFPPGVHLVTLKGNTPPADFLAAFKYDNWHVEYINPTVSPMRELDVSKDCCPIVLLPHLREDVERFIDRLNRLSTQHSATIFVFISNPLEYLYEERMSFTTILTYDKYINGGIVERGVGHIHEGPYTLDPPHSPIEDSPREDPFDNIDEDWQDRAPSDPKPAETVTKIKDLIKTTCGFYMTTVSKNAASALLRGEKTDYICLASCNVQKGDYLVLSVDGDFFHDINEIVWKVTFVSYIPNSTADNAYGQVALSLQRLPNTLFKKGTAGGKYLDNCIVTTTP